MIKAIYEDLKKGTIARDIALAIHKISYDDTKNSYAPMRFTRDDILYTLDGMKRNWTPQQISSGLLTLERSPKFKNNMFRVALEGKKIVYGNYQPSNGALPQPRSYKKKATANGSLSGQIKDLERKAAVIKEMAPLLKKLSKLTEKL